MKMLEIFPKSLKMAQNSYTKRRSGPSHTLNQHSSAAYRALHACTPAHHAPFQCLNKAFWCNQSWMWDCNWNSEKARENPRK